MKRVLLMILFSLPIVCSAQRLFRDTSGTMATDFLNIIGHRDEHGTRIVDHRFMKKGNDYILQLKLTNRHGDAPCLKEGGKVTFNLMFHKGAVTLTCNHVNTIKDERCYADYPITESQLDMIIQNKYVNVVLETMVDTIDFESTGRFNYDLRSAASIIVSGRDIHGDKVKVEERTLPR